jgi:hypothetical protein
VVASTVEIGAAWKRYAKDNTVYHSVKLDARPFLPIEQAAGRPQVGVGSFTRAPYNSHPTGAAMTQIHTRIHVGPDHRITGVAPPDVPPGEHEVTITLVPSSTQQMSTKQFSLKDFPLHDLPWDDSISLHREDMYRDDGR